MKLEIVTVHFVNKYLQSLENLDINFDNLLESQIKTDSFSDFKEIPLKNILIEAQNIINIYNKLVTVSNSLQKSYQDLIEEVIFIFKSKPIFLGLFILI